MKKILAILAAMTLVLSMAACGSENEKVSQGGAAVDTEGNEIIGTTIDGAGDEVDMDKVEGTDVKIDKDVESKTKGNVSGLELEIGEAKLIDNDGEKLLVLTINFKNKASNAVAFDNIIELDVTQNDKELRTALTNNIEGINVRSGIEIIEPGKSTVVQKTYPITDTESPIKVLAYKYGEADGEAVGATFNLK